MLPFIHRDISWLSFNFRVLQEAKDPAVPLLTYANALSVLRLLITVPCACSIWRGAWPLAALLFGIAVVTDFCDGIVARRRGEATPLGGLLDHSIDATFVTTTLAALALIGAVPMLLPPFVVAAFAQYVWDSKALTGAPLRASVLGRWNGVGYYVVVGTAVVKHALTLSWPSAAMIWAAAWLLVATTAASMCDRGIALWCIRRSR